MKYITKHHIQFDIYIYLKFIVYDLAHCVERMFATISSINWNLHMSKNMQ